MKNRPFFMFMSMLFMTFILIGAEDCAGDGGSKADKAQQAATAQAMSEAGRVVGMPAITNWQELKFAKLLFELRDKEDLITYAYIVSLDAKLVYLGKCIGYGLPYSVQFTNPMRRDYARSVGDDLALPQPDPNGLFMPTSSTATWLMMYDEKTGEARPVYVEPQIIVSPFLLH